MSKHCRFFSHNPLLNQQFTITRYQESQASIFTIFWYFFFYKEGNISTCYNYQKTSGYSLNHIDIGGILTRGKYATVTKLPFSQESSKILVSSLIESFNKLRNENLLGSILNEEFIRSTSVDLGKPGSNMDSQLLQLGSSWLIHCESTHGYHYHSFTADDPQLSYRKILFCCNTGFTLEFFEIDHKTEKLIDNMKGEKFIVSEPSIAELEFDGRIVHRFRPLNGGHLFAYSIHYKDLSDASDVAATQTHPVMNLSPTSQSIIFV